MLPCPVLLRPSAFLGGLHLVGIKGEKIVVMHTIFCRTQLTKRNVIPIASHAPALREVPSQLARAPFDLTVSW